MNPARGRCSRPRCKLESQCLIPVYCGRAHSSRGQILPRTATVSKPQRIDQCLHPGAVLQVRRNLCALNDGPDETSSYLADRINPSIRARIVEIDLDWRKLSAVAVAK